MIKTDRYNTDLYERCSIEILMYLYLLPDVCLLQIFYADLYWSMHYISAKMQSCE